MMMIIEEVLACFSMKKISLQGFSLQKSQSMKKIEKNSLPGFHPKKSQSLAHACIPVW
jgi:hypothetical protein